MNTESPQKDDNLPIIAGFAALIENVAHGNLKDRLDKELRELIFAIEETGKGGEISIKLAIKPNKDTGSVFVTGDIKAKKPEPNQRASIFFVTPENNLSRFDHRQRELSFRQDIHG